MHFDFPQAAFSSAETGSCSLLAGSALAQLNPQLRLLPRVDKAVQKLNQPGQLGACLIIPFFQMRAKSMLLFVRFAAALEQRGK
jgi:hypothetical protein